MVCVMSAVPQAYQQAMAELKSGRLVEAGRLLRHVLSLDPGHADALHLLGVLAMRAGNNDAALALISQAIERQPVSGEYWRDLGLVLAKSRRLKEAAGAFSRAVALRPESADAHYNLGLALFETGELANSISAYEQAARLNPRAPNIQNNLGNALFYSGKFADAAEHFRAAIALDPTHIESLDNLGNAMSALGEMSAAIAAYRNAIEIRPDYLNTHSNLAGVLREIGRIDESLASYEAARKIAPQNAAIHSNLIYTLNFLPEVTPQRILEEHHRFDAEHIGPLAKNIRPHENNRDPDRPLRIGYVSPDFRGHIAGWMLSPILEHHDRASFQIICYSNSLQTDAITQRIKSLADDWRSIFGIGDEAAENLIRQDKIDILVDLSMHSADNRLPLFGRKPAPVQISYLGYCGASGISTIDYRLSDPHLDCAETESDYAEKTLFLPQTYWCYQPGEQIVNPSDSPLKTAGYVTFGCLNNFAKISLPVQKLWAEILRQVPESRLLIHCQNGDHRDEFKSRFADWGVNSDRLEFASRQPWEKYMRQYDQIDIALDPFPFAGGITTCDALWMGAPVVTLAGNLSIGRSGKSILTNLGLPELIARDSEQYISIAVALANDADRLQNLRAGMRQRMSESPLMNAPQFARELQECYRTAWREWCGRPA